MLVPSGSVGVLGCVWGGGESLEGDNIGLGGVVAIVLLDCCPRPQMRIKLKRTPMFQIRVAQVLGFVAITGFLRPLSNTDQYRSSY